MITQNALTYAMRSNAKNAEFHVVCNFAVNKLPKTFTVGSIFVDGVDVYSCTRIRGYPDTLNFALRALATMLATFYLLVLIFFF